MSARVTLALLASLAFPAGAVMNATMERPLCDPCAPAAVKKSSTGSAPSHGPALRAQVEAKLRAPFDVAAPTGSMSREQARGAGLGFIERNFDAIDVSGRGAITFDDYKRFLKARGAALD